MSVFDDVHVTDQDLFHGLEDALGHFLAEIEGFVDLVDLDTNLDEDCLETSVD